MLEVTENLSPEEGAFVKRLATAVEQAGAVASIAERSGVPEKTVYNWLAGTNASKAIAFAKIAAAAGASVQQLLGMPEQAFRDVIAPDQAGIVRVPILDISAGAGEGVDNGEVEILGHMPFSVETLNRLRIKPEKVRALCSRGISMQPTIDDGALVLVNTAKQALVDGLIYALRAPDGLRIKRVQRQMDGGVLLISDNRDMFEPERLQPHEAEQISVLGRVFWTEKLL